MQDFYSVSTIYVTKTPPLANGQTGRGKDVSSIEEAARVVCDLRRSGVLQPISVKLEKVCVKTGEVIYVPIEFTDKNGELKPYMEQRVELSMENGKLLGFGSALYKTDEVFDKSYHNAYRGRALAVVRATGKGTIKITAGSAGVESVTAEIEAEA